MKYAKRSRSSRYRKKSVLKKRVFKRRTKSVGFRLKKVEKKVRVLTPETKYFFVPGGDNITYTGAYKQQIGSNPEPDSTFGCFTTYIHGLCALSQGSTQNTRVGLDIVPKSMYVKTNWVLVPPEFGENYPLPRDRQARCVVFQTKGKLAQLYDAGSGGGRWLLPFVDPQSQRTRTPFEPHRLKGNGVAILFDRLYTWQRAKVQNNAGSVDNIGFSTAEKEISIRFKPRYPLEWANADPTSLLNPIYIMWFDDQDSTPQAPFVILTSIMHWFKDNC